MIILDSSTKLQVVLGGAVATSQSAIVVSYHDSTASNHTPGLVTSATNSTTAVDVCPAPASSTQRIIKNIQINNSDTAPITVTFRTNISAALATVFKCTLGVNDNLVYDDRFGWSVQNANGQLQTSTLIGGRILHPPIVIKGSGPLSTPSVQPGEVDGVYNWPAGCNAIEIELWGGGGAGGGAAHTTASNAAFAAGASSAAYLKAYIPFVSGQTTATYNVGTAGQGPASSGGAGAGGTATTFTYNGVTYSASGGTGGPGSAQGTTATTIRPGLPQSVSGGDIARRGTPGKPGIRFSGTAGVSGTGGSSVIGASLSGQVGNSGGTPALESGAYGGNGASSISSAVNGNPGGTGCISIREYYY